MGSALRAPLPTRAAPSRQPLGRGRPPRPAGTGSPRLRPSVPTAHPRTRPLRMTPPPAVGRDEGAPRAHRLPPPNLTLDLRSRRASRSRRGGDGTTGGESGEERMGIGERGRRASRTHRIVVRTRSRPPSPFGRPGRPFPTTTGHGPVYRSRPSAEGLPGGPPVHDAGHGGPSRCGTLVTARAVRVDNAPAVRRVRRPGC